MSSNEQARELPNAANSETKVVGQSVERLDAIKKVTGTAVFAGHAVHLIATPQQALEAAAEAARAAGVQAHILSDAIEGESREVGKVHAALARAVASRGQPFARPCVILSGGETTVTVRPQPPGVPRRNGSGCRHSQDPTIERLHRMTATGSTL